VTIWNVGPGGAFSTIQAAINAAVNGDIIEIAAGTWTEDLTITGKAITIDGVETGGINDVTLNGKITVAGTLNGAFSITDLNINATGKAYGVLVSANSTGFAGSVTLDDVAISNAQQNGFAYIRAGNGSTPTHDDTIGAVSILNSQFSNNATATGSNGRGDILLFGYNQDLTITNVAISSPGAFAQKAIQMRGIQDGGDVVNAGPYDPAGDVAINNLTVTGTYAQDLIAFYRITSFSSFAMSGVDLQASAPWGLLNFDEVGGVINLSSGLSLTTANLSGGPIVAEQGLATGDTFTGTFGTDVLAGRDGADILRGGGGNDTFRYVLGDGADVIDGGADSDTLDYTGTAIAVSVDLGMHTAPGVASFTSIESVTGGSAGDTLTGNADANTLTGAGGADTLDGKGGTDTAVYAGTLAQSALTAIAGHWEVNGGVEGTDTLQNIEIVQHGGGRYLLVGNGGFADATTAVEAATQPGDIIVFATPPADPIVVDLSDTNEDLDVTIPYDTPVDIVTGGGDNHITTGDGDNHITTGGGDNQIVTGDGDNEIITGDGDNEIVTGDGDNEIVTGNGDNEIVTGNGENHVVTGAGEDHVTTGGGGDTVKTGSGNDVVDTGGGEDTIIGGSGNGDDVYNAGIGSDTVVYSSATNAITVDLTQIDRFNQSASGGGTIGDLLTAALLDPHTLVGKGQGVDIGTDALINIENVIGGAGNDSITGDSDANILTGAGGNDILNGGAGADTLDGGPGLDTAVFSGLRSAYTMMRSGNTLAVSGPDGSDTLTHIERLSFADGTVPSGLAPAHSDFSGDGNSDVVWRQDDSGQVYFWGMTGLQTNGEGSVAHAPVTNDWHAEGTGDFNGDGNSDVLWRQDGGQVYIWEMDGLGLKAEGAVAHAAVTNDWQVEGIGDFNGDGNSDVLWRQDGGGQVYIWEMDGLGLKAEGAVAHAAVTNDWQVQGVGDFNGDGNSDVLWRQDGGGQVYIWEMDGLGLKAEGAVAHAAVTNDWQVQGVGDFNGDGNSDVLWRQDGGGQVYIWEMDGLGLKAEGAVAHAAVTNDWHVQSVGDFNGDGNSDVLWRQDSSGQVYVWEMDASQVKAEGAVAHAPVTNDWHVFG
jgi:Ca2+-binding RTX toxin-like protein